MRFASGTEKTFAMRWHARAEQWQRRRYGAPPVEVTVRGPEGDVTSAVTITTRR